MSVSFRLGDTGCCDQDPLTPPADCVFPGPAVVPKIPMAPLAAAVSDVCATAAPECSASRTAALTSASAASFRAASISGLLMGWRGRRPVTGSERGSPAGSADGPESAAPPSIRNPASCALSVAALTAAQSRIRSAVRIPSTVLQVLKRHCVLLDRRGALPANEMAASKSSVCASSTCRAPTGPLALPPSRALRCLSSTDRDTISVSARANSEAAGPTEAEKASGSPGAAA